jgi:hypothetical protein
MAWAPITGDTRMVQQPLTQGQAADARANAKKQPVARWAGPVPVLETVGGRFLWPSTADGTVTISTAQLGYLLEGIDWRMPQKTWRPTAAG